VTARNIGVTVSRPSDESRLGAEKRTHKDKDLLGLCEWGCTRAIPSLTTTPTKQAQKQVFPGKQSNRKSVCFHISFFSWLLRLCQQ
jgi:hypothetical protein